MSYWLGIDLGTTASAAAVVVDGRAEMVDLSHAANSTPSVVVRAEDGQLVVGEQAVRLSAARPTATARQFKRRFGDQTPLMLGEAPFSAAELMAVLFHHVVDAVATQRGELPEGIAVSHPANWGEYKRGLLHDTLHPVWSTSLQLLPEPEAAAIHYASQERVADDTVVAVYDLGGGTFDAAVLRKLGTTNDRIPRWEQLGRSGGIEHLGGIDFDEVVVGMVMERLDVDPDEIDQDDQIMRAAVSQLRSSCREAKEHLSTATSATIVSFLPNATDEIRITRAEFEQLIRPKVRETAEVLADTIKTAFSDAGSVDKVLLVGGSSRIPLIGQVLTDIVGLPLMVDSHPKHAIALGAATAIGGKPPSAPSEPPMPPLQLSTTMPISIVPAQPPMAAQPVARPPMPPTQLRRTPPRPPTPPMPGASNIDLR